MPDEPREKKRIKVTDHRSFTVEGDPRSPEADAESPEPEPAPGKPVRGEGFQMRPAETPSPKEPLPGVDFNSFLLSLSSTAFIHLGELEDPTTGKKQVNLEGARQMIDIIDMLSAKTKGNLEKQEEQFLTGILYELKMKYTQKATAK